MLWGVQLQPDTTRPCCALLLKALLRLKELCLVCRDDARNVLVAMMAEIGVKYLYYAIQTLHNACPAKGYTAHVLGYTLHSILHALAQVPHLNFRPCSLALLRCIMNAIWAEVMQLGAFAAFFRSNRKAVVPVLCSLVSTVPLLSYLQHDTKVRYLAMHQKSTSCP